MSNCDITKAILNSISKKTKLYKIFCISRTKENERKFKVYRNKLNKIIRCARKQYYADLLEKNKNNYKKVWQVIKDLLGKKSDRSFPSFFVKSEPGGTKLTNDQAIADEFNKYFSEIASKLKNEFKSNKILYLPPHFTSYLKHKCDKSIFFNPTTEAEIIRTAQSLKLKNSSGHDGISSRVITESINLIALPLSYVFNLSLSSGVVPNDFKVGKIIPVFKKGDTHHYTNYRPITLLPCCSKLLEKIVYNRVISHLNKHSLLSNSQYGFRANHSCDHALIDLHDLLINNIDNNLHSFGNFLNLSKAFDLIDHEILLTKLRYFGIRGIPLKWF